MIQVGTERGAAAEAICKDCGPALCLDSACGGTLKQVLGKRPIEYRCTTCGNEFPLSKILRERKTL
jgi:hypothetical protein